jgi:hypothetical protein
MFGYLDILVFCFGSGGFCISGLHCGAADVNRYPSFSKVSVCVLVIEWNV